MEQAKTPGQRGETVRVPPAAPAAAAAYFAASLAFHTDVSDVAAAFKAHREEGAELGFQLVDSRSTPSWDQAHVPGAESVPVVTYCWGPACNGGTRSALALAQLGFQVKEMLGGIEYWIREGFEVETWQGREQRPEADPLTAPTDSDDCGC
ncbi:rhodanese-like domain-containing protein [Streptomyces sp. AP-93]|uniref:rhodanese-like domain-containing protein n=1 Tax=Streptomyces sp. AP-93 TaxID=2929048 RepID=UPI001FAFD0F7|nr:rhodanese-like domain-containing protein [Streptomyces sp. AP-93]MCJ0873808.1 rhodanese-like domain-containing protein [Streptomyces sp. AP-93]